MNKKVLLCLITGLLVLGISAAAFAADADPNVVAQTGAENGKWIAIAAGFSLAIAAFGAAVGLRQRALPTPTPTLGPPTPTPPPPAKSAADKFLDSCHASIDKAKALRETVVAAKDHTVADTLDPYDDLSIVVGDLQRQAGFTHETH